MTDYFCECSITENSTYCLLDDDGGIRATAYSLGGISVIKEQYGWGTVHEMTFDGKKLIIGRKLR